MDVRGETYHISYDPTTVVMIFAGVLRMQNADEDAPITRLLNTAAEQEPTPITLDLRSLQLIMMNSTGLGVLIKFMKRVHADNVCHVVIKGNKKFSPATGFIVRSKQLVPGSELHWY